MWHWLKTLTTRKPTTPIPTAGQVWNTGDQQAAVQRLLDLARQRQAEHRYDR